MIFTIFVYLVGVFLILMSFKPNSNPQGLLDNV